MVSARAISGWAVDENKFTFSDHKYVRYGFRVRAERRGNTPDKRAHRGWVIAKLDEDIFDAALEAMEWPPSEEGTTEPEELARILSEGIQAACDAAMPRRGTIKPRKALYWWDSSIARQRRVTGRARRELSRARKRGRAEEALALKQVLRKEKATLKSLIGAAKEKAWAEFLASLNQDPWGRPYKMVMDRLKPWAPPETETMDPVFLEQVVSALFPTGPPMVRGHEAPIPWKPNWKVGEEEIVEIARRLRGAAKAPGPDGIPRAALRRVIPIQGERLAEIFTECLKKGTFPARWKRAKLALIPKDGKPRDQPSSFRPICLLDEMGKALERVISGRILKHIRIRGPKLSNDQYGFREGRSTVDAVMRVKTLVEAETEEGSVVMAVALDITNAFNSLPWTWIEKAVDLFGFPIYLKEIIRSYFQDRSLEWSSRGGGSGRREMSCGVPQGSVLGPLLWNLAYDRVVRTRLPPRCSVVCYADDTLVLAAGDSWAEAATTANRAVAAVVEVIQTMGLKVAPHKSEAMFFYGAYKRNPPRKNIEVAGVQVGTGPTLRYLGLLLDGRWRFTQHFKTLVPRVDRMAGALARLLPNLGGPSVTVRRLYVAVIHSVLLYGSPVWASELRRSAPLRRMVHGPQRRSASRVARAYRTVAFDTVTAIAGVLPAEYLAEVQEFVYRKKWLTNSPAGLAAKRRAADALREEAKKRVIQKWKANLKCPNSGTRRRTIEALRPVLEDWVGRRQGRLSFRLTQLISGHGCFSSFLHTIGKEASSSCYHCNAAYDTAQHTLQDCPAWRVQRETLTGIVGGDLSLSALIKAMLVGEAGWRATAAFAEEVLNLKEEAERERERQARAAPPPPLDSDSDSG